jgi:glutathione S-transferase
MEIPKNHANLRAYFTRLTQRPSVARAIEEARPFFQYFPLKDALPSRFVTGA